MDPRKNVRKRRPQKPKVLATGPISTGTLRPDDVVPELLWVAEHDLSMSRADRRRIQRLRAEVNAIGDPPESDTAPDEDIPEDGIERLCEIWSELEDILTAYAPPGHYVGAHCDDGADIGVWPSEEIPCVCPKIGNVTPEMLDDAAASDGPGDIVFEISDHGNYLKVWTLTVGKTRKWHGREIR